MKGMIKAISNYYLQPLFHEIKPKDRYSAYAVFIFLVAFCVIFLHMFINVPLSSFELTAHAFFLTLPAVLTCLAIECGGRLFLRASVWPCKFRVWQLWFLVGGLATALHSVTWHLSKAVPLVDDIAQKHIDAGHPLCSFFQTSVLIIIIFSVLTEFMVRRSLQQDNELLREANERLSSDDFKNGSNEGLKDDRKIDVKVDGELKRISLNSTAYIQADENYCHLWQCEGEGSGSPIRYTVRSTLKELLCQLPETHFMQTHRSYLVNPAYAKKIKKTNDKFHILLVNDISVPVSRSRIKVVMERYPLMNA